MGINTDDVAELKHDLMEQFRSELPVLRARVRVSQEIIAKKLGYRDKPIVGLKPESVR